MLQQDAHLDRVFVPVGGGGLAAGVASVKYIARMPQQRKLAVLTAFVKAQEITALDDAVDVLDMLILDIIR